MATYTIGADPSDDYTLYSVSGKADNTDHILTGVDILVAGIVTVGLTASADPGADWAATVALYGV